MVQMISDKDAKTHSMGKGHSFQQMTSGKLDTHMYKNKVGPLSYTILKS